MTIKVKNWSSFQHYKNRRPPWIRLYRDLLDDPEYHRLKGDQVKCLILLWLIASEDESLSGNLPSIEKLAFRLRVSVDEMASNITGLSHWVKFRSSDLLAECKQNASELKADCLRDAIPESEGDTESEGEGDPSPSLRSGDTVDLDLNTGDPSPSEATTVFSLEGTDQDKGKKRKRHKPKSNGAKSTPVWEAYSAAYSEQYGTEPTRNARVNSLCCQLVDRLGTDEAPHVAAYYLTSRNGYYVGRGHSLQCLVADAEKLRTEWATGQQMTATRARQVDQSKTTGDAWESVIEELGEDDEPDEEK